MKRKMDEFRALHQGSMSMEEYTYQFMELARYAPEEVNDDEKKQDMFKKGLNPELRTLLTPQIYPDFNTLMNKAILTERAKIEERKDNKRKFLESKSRQQDCFQKPRSFSYTAPRSQAPMQYRTQSQVTGPQAPNTQFRSQNTMKPRRVMQARSPPTTVMLGSISTAERQGISLPAAHMPRTSLLHQPSPTR